MKISTAARKILGQALGLGSAEDLQFLLAKLRVALELRQEAITESVFHTPYELESLYLEASRLITERGLDSDEEEIAILCAWLITYESGENCEMKSLQITRRLAATPHKISNITKTVSKLIEKEWLELINDSEQNSGHNRFFLTPMGQMKAFEVIETNRNIVPLRQERAS